MSRGEGVAAVTATADSMRARPRWWLMAAVLVAVGLVASMCGLADQDERSAQAPEPGTAWFEPLWSGADTLADLCEVGVCVADLVALSA